MIINLTPHTVTLLGGEGNLIAEFPPEGLARAEQFDTVVDRVEVEGETIEVVETSFGELSGLPEPDGETKYIVSFVAAQAAKHAGRSTEDLIVTSGPVRDEGGQVIGCRRFARLPAN